MQQSTARDEPKNKLTIKESTNQHEQTNERRSQQRSESNTQDKGANDGNE